MAKKISSSQLKSKLRQIENKQRQSINNYNNAVCKYNREVNQSNQSINKYNGAVRQHNAKVRQNRARIKNALRQLNNQPTFRITTTYASSVKSVNRTYNKVAAYYDVMEPSTAFAERFYSDVEQEATNCFETANAVLSNDDCPQDDYSLQDTKLLNQLAANRVC